MASKGQEKPKSSTHGVKIDSELIPKASSDIQSELSELGVSVYNQEDLEEGVLRQIDEEVQRRNAEQTKAFLVKDYKLVKSDIKNAHLELKNISKTIAGLLTQPLCNVVLKLRELREKQDVKRKQIQALEAREQNVLKRLSGRSQNESESNVSEQQGSNEIGSISLVPEGHELSERQRLIQTGQITPFDTTSQHPPNSKAITYSEINQSSTSMIILSHTTDHSPGSATDHFTTGKCTGRLSLVTDNSLTGPSTSSSTPVWGVKRKRPSPTLQLSTNSFDGLFSEPSPPVTKRKRNSKQGGRSLKGKDKATIKSNQQNHCVFPSDIYESNQIPVSSQAKGTFSDSTQLPWDLKSISSSSQAPLHVDPLPHQNSGTSGGFSYIDPLPCHYSAAPDESSYVDPLPPLTTFTSCSEAKNEPGTRLPEDNSVVYDLPEDQSILSGSLNGEDSNADAWLPSIAELENFDSDESYESEYYTDEELGPVSGMLLKKKKRKILRALSSDEIESDDDNSKWKKGKRRRKRGKKYGSVKRKRKKYLDDGDEELYRIRIHGLKEESPGEADMEFEGGLRIPGSIWNRLYRYQQTGVKWLWELHCQQAGGIVGDEMGLGKTIEMIAFLTGLKVSNLRSHTTRELGLGPCLIVCPATVMQQWVMEFHIWWSPFRVAILHETGTFSGEKRVLVEQIVEECGVLVTTYAGVRNQDLLLRHKWDYVILDEGHKIRNPDAEITQACKQFPTPHRLILSGSPMQNNLRELWSLFDFVFPGKLGTLPVFLEQFSVPITQGGYANATEVQVQTAYRCACVLRDTINPYLLRRMKADVNIKLPNKNEQVLFCHLTDYQHDLYSDFLKGPEVERALSGRKQIFSALITLRKLCNHPDLITNEFSEQVTVGKEENPDTAKGGQSLNSYQHKGRRKFNGPGLRGPTSRSGEEVYGYHKRSGKMIVVKSLLKLWKTQGHRVLLFSQSKLMLDILEMFVIEQGYKYQRMDGGTSVSTRQPLVNKFNEDATIFVFLLTTRVGGLGINLTGANRIILYDPDWNPSTDTQARERAWRIGQTRPVTIYRLLTSGTIEEKMYHRQIFKQFLTNRVLKDPRQRRFFKSNDVYDLFSLDCKSTDGKTETSALFAGTGSEVVPKKRKQKRTTSPRADDGGGLINLEQTSQELKTYGATEEMKRRTHQGAEASVTVAIGEVVPADSCYMTVLPGTLTEQDKQLPADGVLHVTTTPQTSYKAGDSHSHEDIIQNRNDVEQYACDKPGVSSQSVSSNQSGVYFLPNNENTVKRKTKKKKKHKHRRSKRDKTLVGGVELEGVDHSCTFDSGSGDDEIERKQDDFVLKKLFKRTGVHSALKHDVIMNSADPDYVLVETEAKKVAQSAVRALKASRRHVQVGSRWGRPTWTGNSGEAGAPGPKFGRSSGSQGLTVKKLKHFDGKNAGTTSNESLQKGSLQTSSSILLAKMRSRNATTTPVSDDLPRQGDREVEAIDIHRDRHGQLVKDIRDFIATKCKVDGQASTSEILKEFSDRLPQADTSVFRSLLNEICDFSRHLGDGLWCLKPGFR